MSKVDFWTIIISAVSAIATFSAVLVAIWQTRYTNKKKIKVTAMKTAILEQNISTGKFKPISHFHIVVDAVNVGNRSIVIVEWGFDFTKMHGIQITPINKILPHELQPEKNLKLQAPLSSIRDIIKDSIKNNLKININKKLKFYVKDTLGNKYYTNYSQKIKDIISLKDNETYVE